MAETKPETKSSNSMLTVLVGLVFATVLLNILFIMFTAQEAQTITLLKGELVDLAQQEKIIAIPVDKLYGMIVKFYNDYPVPVEI